MNITYMKLSWASMVKISTRRRPSTCAYYYYFFYAYFGQLLFSFLFYSDQATLSSILQVNVWQRSQSKKKSKKRNLVASGGHCLGELLKKQEHEQSTLIFFAIFRPTVHRHSPQSLKSDFNVELATNHLAIAVDLRMEHSYESGYVLHHISRTPIKLCRSRTVRIPLGSLVSHKYVNFYYCLLLTKFYILTQSIQTTPPFVLPILLQPQNLQLPTRQSEGGMSEDTKSTPMTNLNPPKETSISQSRNRCSTMTTALLAITIPSWISTITKL